MVRPVCDDVVVDAEHIQSREVGTSHSEGGERDAVHDFGSDDIAPGIEVNIHGGIDRDSVRNDRECLRHTHAIRARNGNRGCVFVRASEKEKILATDEIYGWGRDITSCAIARHGIHSNEGLQARNIRQRRLQAGEKPDRI